MPSVSSSAIRSIEWRPGELLGDLLAELTDADLSELSLSGIDGTLVVEFERRGTYEYYRVSGTTFGAFLAASSKGQFFNSSVKNAYNYSRIG